MIAVKVWIRRDEYFFKMDGHATGDDIVCAACSAIAFSLLGYLVNNSGDIKRVFEMNSDYGKVNIWLRGTKMIKPAFEMAYIGLAQIAKKHPDKILIKKF